jgi:glycosyltransferase involved in cell wall biosynthesis
VSKILYIHEGRMRGVGCDLDVQHQVLALAEAGHQVDLISRGKVVHEGVQNLTTQLLPVKIFSSLPARVYNGFRRRYLGWLAERRLRQVKYDAVMAWSQSALRLFRAARHRGIACVLHYGNLHQDYGGVLKPDAPWPRIGGSFTREEIRLADCVVVPSDYCRQSFLDVGVPPAKVVTSHRGVDLSRYEPAISSDGIFRVICLGRVCRRKGQEQLVQAWKLAALKGAELLFVGAVDDDSRELVESSANDPSIRFLGFSREPEKYLKQASVSVLLSSNEGLAKTLIESAACGLPILCTRESGYPLEEGRGGYFVSREDISGVAARLLELQHNPGLCREMGKHNRAQVLREFSWDHSRAQFAWWFESWLAARPRAF